MSQPHRQRPESEHADQLVALHDQRGPARRSSRPLVWQPPRQNSASLASAQGSLQKPSYTRRMSPLYSDRKRPVLSGRPLHRVQPPPPLQPGLSQVYRETALAESLSANPGGFSNLPGLPLPRAHE